jgi:hypothetical protein
VALAGVLAAALRDLGQLLLEVLYQGAHGFGIGLELLGLRVQAG